MNKINYFQLLISFLFFGAFQVNAEVSVDAYELIYDEQEIGTDSYQVKFIVSDNFIRIDQIGDQSGYVIYDDKEHVVYSVAHQDKTVLVIPEYKYQKSDLSKSVAVEYNIVADAPKISGKDIYGYRVTSSGEDKQKCMDIKLAEGLLPNVSEIFASYQKILSGQQSRVLDATPKEYQSSCFLYDQVFNEGEYYLKGLPISEWHSNGKNRLLVSYKKIKVDPKIFQSEESYEKYSLH